MPDTLSIPSWRPGRSTIQSCETIDTRWSRYDTNGYVKPESLITSVPEDQVTLVPPDFEPIYELSEADYQAVINHLAGLLANTIEALRDNGQADRASALATQAHDVLLNYDDDVAEIVRAAANTDDQVEGLGQAREELPF